MGSSWQSVQSNHERSTNKIGNAMEKVSEEPLFKTLQSLSTGEHQINKAMDRFGTRRRSTTSHKSNWIMELILARLCGDSKSKQTPEWSRQVYGVDT